MYGGCEGIDGRSFFTARSSLPVFEPTKEMIEEQTKRAELFQRQKTAGGIIDLKEEAARFDMDSNWRPPSPDRVGETEIIATEKIESESTTVDEEILVLSKIETEEIDKKIVTQPFPETSKQTTNTTTTEQTSPKKVYVRDKQYSGYRRDNYNYNGYRDKPRGGYRQERDRGYRQYNRPSQQQERDKECGYNEFKPRYREYRDVNNIMYYRQLLLYRSRRDLYYLFDITEFRYIRV